MALYRLGEALEIPYVSLLFAAFFCAHTPFVRTAHNVDAMTLINDPVVDFWKSFKEIFQNEEFFIIAFEQADIFTKENLTLIKNITDQLKNLEGVKDIK